MLWVVRRGDALDVYVVNGRIHRAEVGSTNHNDSSDWGFRNVVLFEGAAVVEEELLRRFLDLVEQVHFLGQLVVVGGGLSMQSVAPIESPETSLDGEVFGIRHERKTSEHTLMCVADEVVPQLQRGLLAMIECNVASMLAGRAQIVQDRTHESGVTWDFPQDMSEVSVFVCFHKL